MQPGIRAALTVVLSVLTSWLETTGGTLCDALSYAAVAVAVALLAYAAVVRPHESSLDTAFSIATASRRLRWAWRSR